MKNEYNNYLYKVFYSIDLSNFKWNVITYDCLYTENKGTMQDICGNNILKGQDLMEHISIENYYMIFVDLKAYPLNSECSEIKVFEDFLESDCEMILLCTDSSFIEFYCKDNDILDKVYNNCKYFNFESVEYLSVENAKGRNMIAF